MKYRSEIDGLRALAVIPVILFHAGFDFFSGGFIGVDVFFVISGYLITTIIHDEIKNKSFSIINFYERRVRRILPALFIVCLACIPFSWVWLLPSEYVDFSQSLVAVNLFSSNILFWKESDYFAPAAELKPLLHTWSLAVEEQFYVLFPLMLLLFRKFKDNSLLVLVSIITLLSLGISEYGSRNYPTANFYLLPSRAWELGIGSILAISAPHWQMRGGISRILAFAGLGMVVYSILFFDESVPIPSAIGLIPVVGTALIIAYGTRGTVVGRILGWKPFVGVGLVSYSAYLWHHPLFAFARLRATEEPTPEIYLILSFCSFLLAYLTYRFIETPFRNKQKYSRNSMFIGAITISIAFISFGTIGHYGHIYDVFGNRFSASERELLGFLRYERAEVYRDGSCLLGQNQKYSDFKDECFSSTNIEDSIVIWGDSHAGALSYGLREDFHDITQLTASGCMPLIENNHTLIFGGVLMRRPHCKDINIYVLNKIEQLRPELLVLHANWIKPLNKIDSGISEALSSTMLYVNSISPKTRIVIVGGVPQWSPTLPELLVQSNIDLREEAYVYSQAYEAIQATDVILRDVADKHNATFISLLDLFCKNEKCLSSVKLENTYEPFVWDSGHLTKSASSLVSTKVLSNIGVNSKAGEKLDE